MTTSAATSILVIVKESKGIFASCRLSEIAEIRSGFAFHSRVDREPAGTVAVIQMKDLGMSTVVNLSACQQVGFPADKQSHLLKAGDLLFRSRGNSYGAAIFPDTNQAAVLAAPLLVIRPRSVTSAYLHWFINTPKAQAALSKRARGTSVLMVTSESLGELQVPVPSLQVQTQIAAAAELAEREFSLQSSIAERRRDLSAALLMQCASTSG